MHFCTVYHAEYDSVAVDHHRDEITATKPLNRILTGSVCLDSINQSDYANE